MVVEADGATLESARRSDIPRVPFAPCAITRTDWNTSSSESPTLNSNSSPPQSAERTTRSPTVTDLRHSIGARGDGEKAGNPTC